MTVVTKARVGFSGLTGGVVGTTAGRVGCTGSTGGTGSVAGCSIPGRTSGTGPDGESPNADPAGRARCQLPTLPRREDSPPGFP